MLGAYEKNFHIVLPGEQNNYHTFSYEYVFINDNQMCLKFCWDQSIFIYSAWVY